MVEEITLPAIQEILKNVSSARDVTINDEALTFKYKDKDGDDVLVLVTIVNDEEIVCTLPIKITEHNFVTAMICANMYNARSDAIGTSAYVMSSSGNYYIALETYILTRGGISEASIKYDLRNFVQHIDPFEATMISAINELGPDSSFLKSSGWSSFWEAVGGFFAGYTEAR